MAANRILSTLVIPGVHGVSAEIPVRKRSPLIFFLLALTLITRRADIAPVPYGHFQDHDTYDAPNSDATLDYEHDNNQTIAA